MESLDFDLSSVVSHFDLISQIYDVANLFQSILLSPLTTKLSENVVEKTRPRV